MKSSLLINEGLSFRNLEDMVPSPAKSKTLKKGLHCGKKLIILRKAADPILILVEGYELSV